MTSAPSTANRPSRHELKNDTTRRRPAQEDEYEAATIRPQTRSKRQPCIHAPQTTPPGRDATTARHRRPQGERELSPQGCKVASGRGPRQGLQGGSRHQENGVVNVMAAVDDKSFPRSRSTPRPHDQRSASQLRRAEVFIKSRKAGRRGAPLRQYTSAATSPPTRPKSRASTHRRRSPRRRRRPHVPGPPPRHPTTRHITSAARRQPRQHHQERHRSHQSPPHRTWMRLQRPHQPDPAGNEGQQPPEPRIRRL